MDIGKENTNKNFISIMRNQNRVVSSSRRGGRGQDNKKQLVIVAVVAVVCVIGYLWYKYSLPEQHRLPLQGVVQKINEDGTLKMSNGLTVEMLGVQPDVRTIEFLRDNLVGKMVLLTPDSHDTKPYYLDANKDLVRAYVSVVGVNVNYAKLDGYLIRNNLASFNKGYCQDSLAAFTSYVVAKPYYGEDNMDSVKRTSGKTYTKQELFKIMAPATFLIRTVTRDGDVSIGTGFFINKNGLALTNYHVLAGQAAGQVFLCDKEGNITSDRDRGILRVVQYSQKYDWCIFVVALDPAEESPYLSLTRTRPERGDDVGIVGNPRGLLATFTTGSVTNLYKEAGKIQVDASMTQGNSGGPICNFQGEVVGIAQSVLGESDGSIATGNINFGTDIQVVREALDNLKDVKTYGGK